MPSQQFTQSDPASQWSRLNDELDRWQAAGLTASFWWRDDDAVSDGPRLAKLVELSERFHIPLGLAVIPATLHGSLQQPVNSSSRVFVLQHGYAHIDHSPADETGAWELGLHRGLKTLMDELRQGRATLSQTFGDRFTPVVVPPWNRIADELPPHLAQAGYGGLSAFGENALRHSKAGFKVTNCHCDPVSWKRGGVFSGTASTLDQLLDRLARARANPKENTAPTGYLTHHAVMDDASWDFTETLFDTLNRHQAARFLAADQVFSP